MSPSPDLFSDDSDIGKVLSGSKTYGQGRHNELHPLSRSDEALKGPLHVDRNGYHLVFDTVPAWACDQCGEAYFEEREVNAIQSAIKGLDQQARQLVADT